MRAGLAPGAAARFNRHMTSYAMPPGGLPGQDQLLTGRAVFTDAYAVIPRGTMRDIVTSRLPHWVDTRAWVLARPLRLQCVDDGYHGFTS